MHAAAAAVVRTLHAGKGIREAGSKALEVCQNIGSLRMVRAVMEQMGRCVRVQGSSSGQQEAACTSLGGGLCAAGDVAACRPARQGLGRQASLSFVGRGERHGASVQGLFCGHIGWGWLTAAGMRCGVLFCCVILCRLQPGPGRVNLLYLIDSCLKQQNQLRTSGKLVHAQVSVSLCGLGDPCPRTQ